MRVTFNILKLFGCSAAALCSEDLGVLLLFKAAFSSSACRPRPELWLAVLGLGRIHLAVTGLDPGLVPAGGECYRGRLGRVPAPKCS
jgi:hypothetical protein